MPLRFQPSDEMTVGAEVELQIIDPRSRDLSPVAPRLLEMLADEGWSARRCIPHGGHQMALNIAAGLGLGGNESYPDLFQPFGGFPDNVTVQDGHVVLPDLPGIGFEGKADLIAAMRSLAV